MYEIQNQKEETERYYTLALKEFEKGNNIAYLPTSYCKMGEIAKEKGEQEISFNYFEKALTLAQNSENKQARLLS